MADRYRDRHLNREQRWQGSGYWTDDEEFVEERRGGEPEARRYRKESLDQHYRWQDPRFRRPEGGRESGGAPDREPGQERAWDYASRNWRENEEDYGQAEPGSWRRPDGERYGEYGYSRRPDGQSYGDAEYSRRPGGERYDERRHSGDWQEIGGGWPDWPERQEPNRRQDDAWQNRQRDDWDERQRGGRMERRRGEWQNPERDSWQERGRREGWFAGGSGERDHVADDEFYANRGWARPSSDERERGWGLRGRSRQHGDQRPGRERRLEIDFNRERGQPYWRSEREFSRGVDAERSLSARRGRSWDAGEQRPWDEGQEMSRERGFYQGEDRQRYGEGPHRGAGPKGYQRSDERIKEEVCERLTWHGQIDASNIEIDVKDGEVTLRGQVEHKYEKRMAEDIIESIHGVKDIQNEIHVQKQRM